MFYLVLMEHIRTLNGLVLLSSVEKYVLNGFYLFLLEYLSVMNVFCLFLSETEFLVCCVWLWKQQYCLCILKNIRVLNGFCLVLLKCSEALMYRNYEFWVLYLFGSGNYCLWKWVFKDCVILKILVLLKYLRILNASCLVPESMSQEDMQFIDAPQVITFM